MHSFEHIWLQNAKQISSQSQKYNGIDYWLIQINISYNDGNCKQLKHQALRELAEHSVAYVEAITPVMDISEWTCGIWV